MKNRNTIIGCGILSITFFLIAILVALGTHRFSAATKESSILSSKWPVSSGGDRIGLIQIDGVIHSGGNSGGILPSQDAGSDTIIRALEDAGKDKGVKIVIIRINSPGGSAAASQEIYEEMLRFQRVYKKKIYISMADVAASGGYYIASAANKIYANPATFTGSIGVILEYVNYRGLMDRYDVKPVVMKGGKHKDMGSPYRDLTPEELQIMQGVIDSVHHQFIRDVAKGRHMPYEKVKALADGRIFSGEQAVKLGLIDSIGGMQDTIRDAAKEVGLGDEPEVDNLNKGNPFKMIFNSKSRLSPIEEGVSKMSELLLVSPQLLER